MTMVIAPDNYDGWKLLLDLAKRWKARHATDKPTDADINFFKNRLVAREDRKQKKKKRLSSNIQEVASVASQDDGTLIE